MTHVGSCLRSAFLGLLFLAGCALPQAKGSLYFPDGTSVQYAGAALELSSMNTENLVCTKVGKDEAPECHVDEGHSIGESIAGASSAVMAGLAFWVPFCGAGNC